jgi:hypothetical protein
VEQVLIIFVINTLLNFILWNFSLELPVVRQAIPAINRPSFCRFERYFGLNTAVRTGNLGHFPGAAVAASEASAVAVSVASTVRISSVIKTHFRFTSAYSR